MEQSSAMIPSNRVLIIAPRAFFVHAGTGRSEAGDFQKLPHSKKS